MKKVRKILYGGALIGLQEKKAIMKVVDRNWWGLDKEAELMEKEAAQFLGVKYGVLANSGSSAGLLAMNALDLPRGSEVIISATTFPTIFNTILQCGLVPVVVDAKVGTYIFDIADVEKAISPRTRAIWAIHAVGNVCDMPALMKLAKKHNLYVLEDNCDGWGSSIGKKKIGSFGDISITSFHAAHIVAMGEGGGLFTNNAEFAKRARMDRDWGRQANLTPRPVDIPGIPKDYNVRFVYERIGYNLKPMELQAAMGRIQLRKADKIRKLRQRNFNYFYKALQKYSKYLVMPKWLEGADICWYTFPLSVQNGLTRKELIDHLTKWGIETRTMFAGNILRHPAYKDIPHRVGGSLDGANQIMETSLWFSIHPRLTEVDRKYVVSVFDDFFSKFKEDQK